MPELTINEIAFFESNNDYELVVDYLKMTTIYESAIEIIKTKIKILEKEYNTLNGYNPIHNVESRVKSSNSITKKLKSKGLPVSISSAQKSLKDIAGLRIICNYIDDVYTVFEVLKSQDLELIEVKDYIKSPKPNGYRSLHMVVLVTVRFEASVHRVPVEIQLRTIAMDFWASLEHKLRYKKDKKTSAMISLRLKSCAELSNKLDEEMQKINVILSKSE